MHRRWLLSLVLGLLPIPAGTAAEPDVKAVIDKAIEAYGGEANLAQAKALRLKLKGTLEVQGQSVAFTGEALVQVGGGLRNEIHVDLMGQKFSTVQGFDGEKGWMKVLGMVKDLDGDKLREMKEEGHASRVVTLLPLRHDKALTVTALPATKIKDRPAVGVKIAAKGFKDVELYFDAATGLIAKTQRTAVDTRVGKEVKRESYFSDFKDTDGLKYASKMQIHIDGAKVMEAEITEHKVLDKIDPKEFAKP